jgi:hypothetical protein
MVSWQSGRTALFSLLLLAAPTGCLSFCHPIAPAGPESIASCAAFPACARNHVHVFFVHGLDPLDLANFEGVRDYVQQLGFVKTHFGQWYHQWSFRGEIRKIHQDDPDAHFAVIGFSWGASMVRDLVNAVKDDGISIDLLVYLGGCVLTNSPETRPENAGRVINILAVGGIFNGTSLPDADNIRYNDVLHFGSPTHSHTLQLLASELALVAARVPVPVPAEPPPQEEALPRPRQLHQPMPPADPEARDDWDFLKPSNVPAPSPPRTEDARFKRSSPISRPDPGLTSNR